MSDAPSQKLVSEGDLQVGDAWSKHYNGQNDEAVAMFQKVVETWPESIDGHYGLGLCLQAAGQKTEAAKHYLLAKGLVEQELTKPMDDSSRYHMLSRMLEQRLESVAIPQAEDKD